MLDALRPLCLLLCLVPAAAEEATWCDDTEGKFIGPFFFPAWQQHFEGTHCRTVVVEDGEIVSLTAEIDQTAVTNSAGYDVGAGRAEPRGRQASERAEPGNRELTWAMEVDVELHPRAYWWAGPKSAITDTPTYVTLIGNYECYVVEASSKTAEEIIDELDLQFAGETEHDGVTYRHHTKPLHGIHQVWSLRDGWVREGSVPVDEILAAWVELGTVDGDFFNLGWKINVETSGKIQGTFTFTDLDIPSLH